jgi:two-component system phosphate regulon response regulator PhoB
MMAQQTTIERRPRDGAFGSPPSEPREVTPVEPHAPSERGERADDGGRSSERTAERRVLVIEDEPDIRDLLSYNLQSGGFQVKTADTGTRGLALFETFDPDVILLDLMLPDVPGTEVCRRIRARTSGAQPAIIILTAKGEEIDRVVGFEVGADDYVVKPFSVRELLLRVNAVLRGRSAAAGAVQGRPSGAGPAAATAGGEPSRKKYTVGPLRVDVDGHYVFVKQNEIHVSAIEMRLLVYLISHRGRVRSREDLLEDVWGYKPGVSTRTVDTHVKRLRDKLGTAGGLIETVRGTGYRLADSYPVLVEGEG